jgi:hypothetical protein
MRKEWKTKKRKGKCKKVTEGNENGRRSGDRWGGIFVPGCISPYTNMNIKCASTFVLDGWYRLDTRYKWLFFQ